MTRAILMVLLLLNGVVFADKPVGFLWYTKEKENKSVEKKKPAGIDFNNLSYRGRVEEPPKVLILN